MAGRTIEVSGIPFIPNKELLVDFLEEVLGNGCIRACRLMQSSSHERSSSSSCEREGQRQLRAIVETESTESAKTLHKLAKAGILVFWYASLTVKFVSCPDPHLLCPPDLNIDGVPSDPEMCVSEKRISIENHVLDPDVSVSKVAPHINFSEPKQLSEPRVSETFSGPKQSSEPRASEPFSEPKQLSLPTNPEPFSEPQQLSLPTIPEPFSETQQLSLPTVSETLSEPEQLSEPRASEQLSVTRVSEPFSEPKVSEPFSVLEELSELRISESFCVGEQLSEPRASEQLCAPTVYEPCSEGNQLSEPSVSEPEVVHEAPVRQSHVPWVLRPQYARRRP